MRFSKLSLLAVLAAVAVVGFTFDGGPLKITAKKDDVHKYSLKGTMEVQGMDIKLSGVVTDKVIDVADNGNVTTKSTQSDMMIEVAGASQPAGADRSSTNVVRPDGTTAEIRGEASGPEAYRMATINTIKLPDFALEKDKTWTWDCPADKKTGIMHTKGEYKVLGDEKLHDIDCWKISLKVTELEGDTPASEEGTVWLSKSDAMMVKADGKGTNMPITGVGPITGSIVIELTPDK